ncbi:MAG: hypothetical protein WC807_18695 [Hyphomicrobium sp.]
MTAPNVVNVATITGKNSKVALTSTSATAVVNNPASSGKVFKVNSLVVANIDGVNAADITVGVYSQDDLGGTAYRIAYLVTVPAKASLIVIGKENPVYLEEDQSIGATAAVANDLEVVASYEEIS